MSPPRSPTRTGEAALRPSPSSLNLADAIEIIPDRFFWTSTARRYSDTAKEHFFCTDDEYYYENFAEDFGPLNLAVVARYCRMLEDKLSDPAFEGKRIIHYCSQIPQKRTNAACLAGAYQVVVLRKPAAQAYELFNRVQPFMPYRDALSNRSTFDLHIDDCLNGLQKAIELGWFDYRSFSVESFEYFSMVENGDLNWIVPGKFIAFTGPSSVDVDAHGYKCFTPEDYLPLFHKARVGLIVRLNSKQYDRYRFISNGIKHIDLYFRDGSCPPPAIISKFMHVCEREPAGVSVHCKAGLGRTGCLIGLYAMKHFAFPARAWIAWNRLCRPGSILGPQQQFMIDMQDQMFQAGHAMRGPESPLPFKPSLADLAAPRGNTDHTKAENHTDHGQGDRLCSAKRSGSRGVSPKVVPQHASKANVLRSVSPGCTKDPRERGGAASKDAATNDDGNAGRDGPNKEGREPVSDVDTLAPSPKSSNSHSSFSSVERWT